MGKKKYPNTAAVINIASGGLSLHIAQLSKGKPKILEELSYALPLGHEVFTERKISFESLREMSKVLAGFSARMKEYGVTRCRAVATTALREAENRAFVLDQLKVQNSLDVEVLEPDQEKTLIYSEILATLSDAGALETGCSLFAYIGSGTVGTAVYDGSAMVFSRNIPIGALKLHDMLGSVQETTDDFSTVTEEYLAATLELRRPFKVRHPQYDSDRQRHGTDCKTLRVQRKQKAVLPFPWKRSTDLYDAVRPLRADKIAQHYGISEGAAETMYAALAIYLQIIGKTKVRRVLAPQVDLWDALLSQMLLPKRKASFERQRRENAVCCARHICGKLRMQRGSCGKRGGDCLRHVRPAQTAARHGAGTAADSGACGRACTTAAATSPCVTTARRASTSSETPTSTE